MPAFRPIARRVAVARHVPTAEISRECGTQCRTRLDQEAVQHCSELMREGVTFPPICLYTDGQAVWLVAGFHRVAAAELAGLDTILAAVIGGTLEDAVWASCGCNGTHGVRRSRSDVDNAIEKAFAHPNSKHMSNSHLARYIGVAESTIRRHLGRLSSPRGEDAIRFVTRGGQKYRQDVRRIGSASAVGAKPLSRHRLKAAELDAMKAAAGSELRALFTIFGHWLFGSTPPDVCSASLQGVLDRVSGAVPSRGAAPIIIAKGA